MKHENLFLVTACVFLLCLLPFLVTGFVTGVVVFGLYNRFQAVRELNDWLNKISGERTDAKHTA